MNQAHKAFVSGVIALAAFATPLSASAQAVIQTVQLLPPTTTNTCPLVTTQGIVAHVQGGALHSFDVTLGNATYIGISAQVGATSVPFNFMTRFDHGGGFMRHHVDLYTTPIHSGGLPISLTLLSSPPGSPTCLTIVSFTVAPDGSIMAPGFTSTPTTPATDSGQGSTAGSKPVAVKPSAPVATSTATTTEEAGPGVISRIQGLCSGNSSTQLWFLLLAIYVVVAALTAFARPPLAADKLWVPLAAILAPLVLLLLFWYFAPMCRAGGWVPAVAIIIGIVALLVAFRDQNSPLNLSVIPLPAAKSPKPSPNTPVVTKGSPSPATNPVRKAADTEKK